MISADQTIEDRLDSAGMPFRSRGEAQVASLLNQYGIPFLYEQPTLIYDRRSYRVWHPDFTLPSYRNLIVEYAGMMDVPDYRAGILHKQQAYAANGIPAVFVYPHDLYARNARQRILERINSAYEQALLREAYRQLR